jgi:hypothetical protein
MRTRFDGDVRTPPKLAPTGTENLEGCRGRADEGADSGEGDEPRGEHFSRLERGRGPVGKESYKQTRTVGIRLVKKVTPANKVSSPGRNWPTSV